MGESSTDSLTWQPWNKFNNFPVPNSITSDLPFFRLKCLWSKIIAAYFKNFLLFRNFKSKLTFRNLIGEIFFSSFAPDKVTK